MRKTIRGLRNNPEMLVAAIVGLGVGVLSVLLISPTASSDFREGRLLVNLFKFAVGAINIAMALYLHFGPALAERGIASRWLPNRDVPVRVIVAFFTLGAGAVMTSLAILRPGYAHVLFWELVGFAIFLAVSVGFFVLILERSGAVDVS